MIAVPKPLSVLELCAGAGGQALGIEAAGFDTEAAVEIDAHACATLRLNRPHWDVRQTDLRTFDARPFRGTVDLVAGGVPCPPFSIAGKQLGPDDERDLFPTALSIIEEVRPSAVLLENVRGLADAKFDAYRNAVIATLEELGYRSSFALLHASEFGVPQLRPRFLLVALRPKAWKHFAWPAPQLTAPPTVGETLRDLMAARGWRGADAWARRASGIAPTLVGGSKKHGGPDLGPTRARAEWAKLGVDGLGLANEAPGPDAPEDHVPRLTVRMAARIQGFPETWQFTGGKTASYRQVGNAFPPPVAKAVGLRIAAALRAADIRRAPAVVSSAGVPEAG
jgi:DNA (cytosine-5)-methyltransferase 1